MDSDVAAGGSVDADPVADASAGAPAQDAAGESADTADGAVAVAESEGADLPNTTEATINTDGTITLAVNGKTYEVQEVDPAPPATLDKPKVCGNCGETFNGHEIVLGNCQPCNSSLEAKAKAAGSELLEAFKKLIGAGDQSAAAE